MLRDELNTASGAWVADEEAQNIIRRTRRSCLRAGVDEAVSEGADFSHFRIRPHWDCGACGNPWPCETAKMRLLREYRGNRTALISYMVLNMFDLLEDFAWDADLTNGSAYARCVTWIRQQTAP